eukprot:6457214-Amphidinium_carterae.1
MDTSKCYVSNVATSDIKQKHLETHRKGRQWRGRGPPHTSHIACASPLSSTTCLRVPHNCLRAGLQLGGWIYDVVSLNPTLAAARDHHFKCKRRGLCISTTYGKSLMGLGVPGLRKQYGHSGTTTQELRRVTSVTLLLLTNALLALHLAHYGATTLQRLPQCPPAADFGASTHSSPPPSSSFHMAGCSTPQLFWVQLATTCAEEEAVHKEASQ